MNLFNVNCFRHLLNTTVPSQGDESVFKQDGTKRKVTLKIINPRPTLDQEMKWEEVSKKIIPFQSLKRFTFRVKLSDSIFFLFGLSTVII